MSKLSDILRAMDAYERRNAPTEPQPSQDSAVCALEDCDEPAAYRCVCCNRRVCFYDISGAVSISEPGICHECLTACAGGMACQVVTCHTCHTCGAVVDGDALTVQTAANGTPKLGAFYCQKHLIAGTERVLAAIRAQGKQTESEEA